VRYICGSSRICMTMMVLRDLPHTCACTWCCIQTKWWKRNYSSAGFKNQGALNLLKLNINLTMRLTLAILEWPPGRALFNVKRTLRVLIMEFCRWELNIVTIATPLIFFLFWILFIEQDAWTNRNSKTRYGLKWKELTSGSSHTSPTLGVCVAEQ